MRMQSSDEQPTNDHPVEFFHTLSQAKQITVPEPLKPTSPRLVGLVLGAILGLVYGIISQIVNQLLMPGVPFAQYPFGLWGNCLISIMSGTIIGLVCATPRSSVTGAFLGSVVAAVVAILQWLAAQAASSAVLLKPPVITPWAPFEIVFFLMLFVPFMLLFRLAVDNQIESAHKPVWAWARLRVPLVLVVIVGAVGAFSLFPNHVQRAMTDMHALIQTGLSVSDAADLPPSLGEKHGVADFLDYATSDYTLESSQDLDMKNDLADPSEIYSLVIIARFKSNWILACSYDENGNRSRCKSYVTPEFFLRIGLASGHANVPG